jgi:predicted Rossmann-fold nucleotide-binding protein
MAQRKAKMIELGDAFIAFPGGTGTLEEIAEVMSKVSLGHLDPIRALTVGVTRLSPADQVIEQVSLFDLTSGNQRRERQESLEKLVDALRDKHGEKSITLGYQENKEIGVERGETRR